MLEMNNSIIYMLFHETKSLRVRVTYLASGWNVCWALSGGCLDAGFERGSQAVLGALDLKEKRSKRDASVIRRGLKWLSFRIEGSKYF